MWKIGNVGIDNRVVLAPMAGISNPAYMKIVEEMGCGLAFTELISAEAIVRNNKKTFDMLNGIESLKIPVGVQLFGSNAAVLSKAANIITKLYNIKIIDINMGCPVPKVALRSQAGSALLKDPDKVKEIVSAVVKAVKCPVTVKIRSGWDKDHINAVEIAKICEEAGASAISVHARTRSQGYSGEADWNIIRDVKNNVNIPVIGNGDVTSPEKAKEMLDFTGCDAVMIGRAALGNPWIIRNTLLYLEDKSYTLPTTLDRIDMCIKHLKLLGELKTERQAVLEIRSHVGWYLKGIKQSNEIKNKIYKMATICDILHVLKQFKEESNEER